MVEGVAERRPMTPFARASAAAVTARSTAAGEGRPPCAHTPHCHPAGRQVAHYVHLLALSFCSALSPGVAGPPAHTPPAIA